LPSGLTATESGRYPTVSGATVCAATSMMETVSSPELATYAVVPSGLKATDRGASPTLIVAVTVSVSVLITDTVLAVLLAT